MGIFHRISLTVLVIASGADAVKFTITNNCSMPVWPGWMSNENGKADPMANGGGTQLAPGQSTTIEVPDGTASARIWPRTGCTGSDGSLKCETGDCGPNIQCNGKTGAPPASLAEFTLAKDTNGQDTYDVSYVDGYNVMTIMKPVDGTFDPAAKNPGQNNFCNEVGKCSEDLKTASSTPANLKLPSPSDPKQTMAVSGLCGTGGAQCCQGGAEKCQPSSFSPEMKAKYDAMKANCKDAYLYDFDDAKSTYVCKGKGKPSPDYQVSFCSDTPVGMSTTTMMPPTSTTSAPPSSTTTAPPTTTTAPPTTAAPAS